MKDTVNLLETALENELGQMINLINGMKREDLLDLIRVIAYHEPSMSGFTAVDNIIRVAKNAQSLSDVIDNFYTVHEES